MWNKTSEEKILEFKKLYELKISATKIATITNVHHTTVRTNLKKLGLTFTNKKYSVNDQYLDTIDTEDKAYFLGLFASDGYNNEKRSTIEISLQEGDIDILEKLKQKLEYTGPLTYQNRTSVNRKNKFKLSIRSKKLSERLKKLGFPQKKSLILQCPNYNIIPKHLYNHFLRGYIDGDGTIHVNKNLFRSHISLCGSIFFIPEMKEKIQEILDIKVTSYINTRNRKNPLGILCISTPNRIIRLLNYLYDNANIYMNRKYNKNIEYRQKFYELKSNGKIKNKLSKKEINEIIRAKINRTNTNINLAKQYKTSIWKINNIWSNYRKSLNYE